MSLATDSIFIDALRSSSSLMETLDGNIYGTTIALPDEHLDNAPVPYAIVTFNSLTNDNESKDDDYESIQDNVSISIEVTGETLDRLHKISAMVRHTVLNYLRNNATAIEDYNFTAGAIQYDSFKPCYWQQLSYMCTVITNNNKQQEKWE